MRSRNGIFALLLIGGYFAWRNRSRIQRMNLDNIRDTVRSGVAKVTGTIGHQTDSLQSDQNTRQAV